MKKIFLVIVSIMLTMTAFAQNKQESEHLSFKGVPIDGTLKAYTEAMKSAGFTYLAPKTESPFCKVILPDIEAVPLAFPHSRNSIWSAPSV